MRSTNQSNHYKNLVLGGGGIKGISYIGLYKYFTEFSYTFENYCGTSIGAIFCSLIRLNHTPEKIYNFTLGLYKKGLSEINIIDLFSKKNGFSLLSKKDYKNILTELIPDTLTFSQLHKQSGKNLFVVCSDLQTQSQKIFSNKHTPDFPVYKALMASSCVPLLLPIVKNRYIDGGIMNNIYPNIPRKEKSIFFVLKSRSEYVNDDLFNYVSNILRMAIGKNNEIRSTKLHTVIDIYSGYNSSDFNVLFSEEDINKAIKAGYDCVTFYKQRKESDQQ
jgi:predicted acylesterase/phospholipase RssA